MIAGGQKSMPNDSPITWTSMPSLSPIFSRTPASRACTPVPSLVTPAPIQPRQSLPTDVAGKLACELAPPEHTSPNVFEFGPG